MVKIIKANPDHAALISELGKATFIESHSDSASAENVDYYIAQKFTTDIIRAEIDQVENIFHLLFVNDEIAGYSKIIVNAPNEKLNKTNVTKLERLYILKKFYDLKLGLQLFDFNVQLSKKLNQAGIWLNVWTENHRAVSFYKKAGFKIIGDTSFFISPTHANPNYWLYLEF